MKLIPLPAFQDDCPWLFHDGQRALAVDPGDAQPVMASVTHEGLELDAILVTHDAPVHIGGVDAGDGIDVPGETRVCCTHEHTLSNRRFARAVEPGNLGLISYAKRREEPRSQGLPTQVKPFLRPRETAVAQAARGHDAATPPDEGDAVAPLRQWKNEFR